MSRGKTLPVTLAGLAVAAAVGLGAAAPVVADAGGPPQGAPSTTAAAAARTAPRPNVLLVKTDDQVLDSMERLAQYMPWTAQWFGQGRRFTQAIVANPSCCQSRATTFVGRYPHNHKVWSQGSAAVLDSRGGIAPYLSRAGYRTGIVGKFLNLVWTDPPGYQDWTTTHGDTAGEADPTTGVAAPTWYRNFHATDASGDTLVPDYATAWTAGRVRQYLAGYLADPATPWFLEWDPVAPHTHDHLDQMVEPVHADAPVPGCPVPDEADVSDKPAYVQAFDVAPSYSEATCVAAQRTLLTVDRELRSIVRMVADAGQLENTLVVFTSDNGLMNGEHGGMARKYVPYEPSIRVPLFLRWDGHVTPGVDDRLTTNTDLLPTILDATGVRRDLTLPAVDGVSLLPGSGPRPAGATPTVQLTEYRLDPGWSPAKPAPIPTWAALRTTRWKYVESYADKAGTTVAFREFYDLAADPGELTNLLADGDPANDPAVDVWSATLARMRTCKGAGCTTPLPVPSVTSSSATPQAVRVAGTAQPTSTVVVSAAGNGSFLSAPVPVGADGTWSASLDGSTFAGAPVTVTAFERNCTGATSRKVAQVLTP